MGNTVGTPIVSEYLEDEVGPIVCQNSLGNASRFLKTVKAYHEEEGYVVVKIYKKRYFKENLTEKCYKALNEIKESFQVTNTTYFYYNIMPYQNFLETERSGYLIRQYFHTNLYDRISTRPFLSMIEKKFVTYQLLKAVEQCFFRGIYHGDIKCENVMVTTTNWIYLTDFACYKPTFIPEDNPSDFSFFFDTSGRRTCYIAPERFYETNKGMPTGELNIKMDIFSLGCVIAEIFLEGVPIFDFSQLLSYRKGEYSPESVIRKIPDPHIQSLILHMIQKEPDNRFSPVKYLENWKNKAFPAYFDFAHQFFSELMKLDNDDRILCLSEKFDEIIQVFTGAQTGSGSNSPMLQSSTSSIHIGHSRSPSLNSTSPIMGSSNSLKIPQREGGNSSTNLHSEANLMNPNTTSANISKIILNAENFIKDQEKFDNLDLSNFTLEELNIVNSSKSEKQQQTQQAQQVQQRKPQPNSFISSSTAAMAVPSSNKIQLVEGLDIFLALIYSALKYCKYPHTKVKCVGSLFERFALYLDDECRLQKIVPYLMSMIVHHQVTQPSLVRVEALRSLAKVLEMVQTFPPSESLIFSQYILPSLSQLAADSTEEIVRIAYAEVLPQLATTAKRYLEIAQRHRDPDARKDRSKATAKSYDAELNEIQDLFLIRVSDLLTKDSCITLKRIILSDIYRLCVFFGRQKTNESVLPLIITFLNDKDWQLRCAFFENIVAVCTVVGSGSLESFIYPCILLALADEEEFVTEKAIASLTELCSLGLLRKNILLELLIKTSPMLLHPNNWIRYAVISLIIKICSSLSKADLHCYAKPKLSMYLTGEISDNFNENNLFHLLESPISKESFNKIVKLIYKNQITMQSSMHSNNSNDEDRMGGSPSSQNSLLNLGSTSGSYRRLRALSQKLYPVNGSYSSPNGVSSTFSNLDEQQQEFLAKMNDLKIPPEDQEKIFKCLDYLLLKKYKDEESNPAFNTNASNYIQVTSGNIIRQSIAKSQSSQSSLSSSSTLPSSSSVDIVKLQPNVPFRTVKMRAIDPTISSSSVNLPAMSASTNSLPQLNISRDAQPASINTSSNSAPGNINPGINNSGINNSGNLNQSNQMNSNPNNNPPNTGSPSANQMNNPNNNLVNQLELNVVTKKFKIISKEKHQFHDMLKVEINTDCFIHTAPPLPDLGNIDQSTYTGLSALNNSLNPTGHHNAPGHMNPNSLSSNNSPLMMTSAMMINESSSLPSWKPQGILVSHFFEHKAAVNEIQVSSDNMFFATASNDGTVKIWDCQRMEKSVTNKSRLTYNQDGGRITSISICEKSHSIASASDRGSIHVFKVGIGGKQKSGSLKYTGFSTVKNITESEGNIVSVDHYSTNSASIVTYATSRGGIKGWDLRSAQEAFSLASDPSLGLIQTLLIDPNRNWFITSTSRGFITCWDLRFKIPIYNHRVTKGRIFKMIPYLGGLRTTSETSWVYISTEFDNCVVLFDLASKNIRRVFKRSYNDPQQNNNNNNNNNTFNNNNIPNSTSSSSISTSSYDFGIDNMKPILKSNILPTIPHVQSINIPENTRSSVMSLPINPVVEHKMPTIRAMLSPINCSYLITAGNDKRIKFWEGKNINDSNYISIGKEPPPPFTHKYSNDTSQGLETFEELWCDTSQSSFYSNSIQSSTSSFQPRPKQKSPIQTPTIHHHEPILDLKIMEVPHPMLISSSTDGIVKVWK